MIKKNSTEELIRQLTTATDAVLELKRVEAAHDTLTRRIAELEAALLFALPLLEEECRPGAPLLRQVYAALKMNQNQEDK